MTAMEPRPPVHGGTRPRADRSLRANRNKLVESEQKSHLLETQTLTEEQVTGDIFDIIDSVRASFNAGGGAGGGAKIHDDEVKQFKMTDVAQKFMTEVARQGRRAAGCGAMGGGAVAHRPC